MPTQTVNTNTYVKLDRDQLTAICVALMYPHLKSTYSIDALIPDVKEMIKRCEDD